MDKDLNWRPSVQEIAAAEKLLANTTRFQTRLKILCALKKQPDAPLKVIAGAAETRTAVVKAFLNRWRTHGTQSVIAFGRLTHLNIAEQRKLKTKIACGRLKSLREVGTYIEAWFGRKLDLRSIRSCCDQLGFNLPAKSERKATLHASWNNENIARLSGDNERLKERLSTIIRACNEPGVSLRDIAGQLVPESTLRADLKAIKPNTTMEMFLKRRSRLPRLDRLNLRREFRNWVAEQSTMKGRPPSAREVVTFLKKRGVNIATKTAYTYLHEAGVETRKYRPGKKFVPSEGIAVRSLL